MPTENPDAESYLAPVYTSDQQRAVLFMQFGRGCARCCEDPACRRARICLRYYEGCLALPAEGVDAGLRREEVMETGRSLLVPPPPDPRTQSAVASSKRRIVRDVRTGQRQSVLTQGKVGQAWLGGKPLHDLDEQGLYRTMPPLPGRKKRKGSRSKS